MSHATTTVPHALPPILCETLEARRCLSASYTITDLGAVVAYDVNNAGQVVGATQTHRAFVYAGGATRDLGTLGGTSSTAAAVNDAGLIVGNSRTRRDATTHACLWQPGRRGRYAIADLGTLPGGTAAFALDVNASGQTVGYSTVANGARHAFSYYRGKMTDLGTLGGTESEAMAVNASGEIVGYSMTRSGDRHACAWYRGKITDLGVLPGGASSMATCVSNSGLIAGVSSHGDGFLHAFTTVGRSMIDAGRTEKTSRPSFDNKGAVTAINKRGQFIGWYATDLDAEDISFIDNGDGMTPLATQVSNADALRWYFDESYGGPVSINDHGQICGQGIPPGVAHAAQNTHAYLLTPTA